MVPGMYHCMGGPGCTAFDPLDWIDQWVTSMIAPDRIVASYRSDGRVDRTVPLCPYPQRAVWSGYGDRDSAGSFTCQEH